MFMRKIENDIEIIEKKIEADHYFTGIVRAGGNSARVNLPLELIGKRVYVIVLPDKTKPKLPGGVI